MTIKPTLPVQPVCDPTNGAAALVSFINFINKKKQPEVIETPPAEQNTNTYSEDEEKKAARERDMRTEAQPFVSSDKDN